MLLVGYNFWSSLILSHMPTPAFYLIPSALLIPERADLDDLCRSRAIDNLYSAKLRKALARLDWLENRTTTENVYVHEGQQWRSYTGPEIVGLSARVMAAEQRATELSSKLTLITQSLHNAEDRAALWAGQLDKVIYRAETAEKQRDAARINQKYAESREQAANERFIAVSRQLAAANARPAAPNWLGYHDETVTIGRGDAGDGQVCLAREEWLRRADECPQLEQHVKELRELAKGRLLAYEVVTQRLQQKERELAAHKPVDFGVTWYRSTEKLVHLADDGDTLTIYDAANTEAGVTLTRRQWIVTFREHARMKAARSFPSPISSPPPLPNDFSS